MSLTTEPIPKLLRTMAVPASIGFFFNTMYNVVDTYFGGRVSTTALAALSLAFPVFMVVLAIAQGISSGTGALIANALGAGKHREAVVYQAQAIAFGIVTAVILTIPLYFLLPLIFRALNAEGEQLASALRYTRVIILGAVFFVSNNVLNAGLAARGDTKSFRNFLIIGFFLNIGLDPLLLYGLRIGEVQVIQPLAETGIALATIIIQGIGVVYLLPKVRARGSLLGATLTDFVPQGRYIREIAGQGIPAAVNMMAIAVGSFVITYFVARFGSAAVAAYGSALRIEQIALVPTIGLNVALAALVGQNNGAGRLDRVIQSFHVSLRYGLVVMVLILTPVLIFAPYLMRVFTTDQNVVAIGLHYLYVQALTFYSYVLMNQCNAVLQGLKRPGAIMWVGLYRQLLAPLVVFTVLVGPAGLGVRGVWWGLVGVNWSAALWTAWHTRRLLRQRQQ